MLSWACYIEDIQSAKSSTGSSSRRLWRHQQSCLYSGPGTGRASLHDWVRLRNDELTVLRASGVLATQAALPRSVRRRHYSLHVCGHAALQTSDRHSPDQGSHGRSAVPCSRGERAFNDPRNWRRELSTCTRRSLNHVMSNNSLN